jgi:hypothetical protein
MLPYQNKRIVDLSDWDNLVRETYGKPYSFQQQDGCQSRGSFKISIPDGADDYENDTVSEEINSDEMGVSFKSWLERHPKEWNGNEEDKRFLNMYWERNFYPSIQMIANDLHEKGLIEAGDYVIEIDW